jgi:hypothetical protein
LQCRGVGRCVDRVLGVSPLQSGLHWCQARGERRSSTSTVRRSTPRSWRGCPPRGARSSLHRVILVVRRSPPSRPKNDRPGTVPRDARVTRPVCVSGPP